MAKKEKSKKNGSTKSAETTTGTKVKRAKVRLVDPENPSLWVRAYVDVIEQFGVPLTPSGQQMVPGKAQRGLTDEERARRQAEKEAEKAKFDSMSDEEKLAYAKAKREERAARRAAKKAAEREALIAQIKAEIAAGNL